MSLGNFRNGSVVRLPLHIIQDGGIPITDAQDVFVRKVILPNGKVDGNFPVIMKLADPMFAIYYVDYKPSAVGNYIVIYSFVVDSITYSSIDTFNIYNSAESSSGLAGGFARPMSFINS